MIYAVVSDIHCRATSVFARTNADGVNSRLRVTLQELERAAAALRKANGEILIIAGDILHDRGVIDPEVLNPLQATIQNILDQGISILAIPGNHDLKSADTQELSSAIQNLAMLSGELAWCNVINKRAALTVDGARFGFVPWRASKEALLEDLKLLADTNTSQLANMDVFIHAGIEGVLPNLTHAGSGLTDKILGDFGFRHVFAGHYHNHKVLNYGVISIGATTHQNWGDIGSRAGFLLVDSDTGAVTFNDTHAPKFVDISGMSEADMQLECDGNYVRFRGPQMTQSDINELRAQLNAWGALGVSIEVPKAVTSARSGASHTTGLTLGQSVSKFIDESKDIPAHVDRARVKQRADEVLAASTAAYEDA